MKKLGFHYIPEIVVEFSNEDIEILMYLSKQHYDLACKNAGLRGGFLYALHIQKEVPSKDFTAILTQSKIDVLCKITEMPCFKERETLALHALFLQLNSSLNSEYIRLNKL